MGALHDGLPNKKPPLDPVIGQCLALGKTFTGPFEDIVQPFLSLVSHFCMPFLVGCSWRGLTIQLYGHTSTASSSFMTRLVQEMPRKCLKYFTYATFGALLLVYDLHACRRTDKAATLNSQEYNPGNPLFKRLLNKLLFPEWCKTNMAVILHHVSTPKIDIMDRLHQWQPAISKQ